VTHGSHTQGSSTPLHGEYKVPGGKLVVVDFTVTDGTIHSFSLSGDFFLEPDDAILDINRAIEGMPAGETAGTYAERITETLGADTVMLGITPEGVGIAIRRALTNAAAWRDLDWSVIVTPKIAPALNAALDEVLVNAVGKGERGPTMRIWDWDSDAVIIGSFQSVKNEVDEVQAAELDTQVIRRISGGGAMYMQPASSITYSLYAPTSFVDGMSFEASYAFLDEWVLETLYGLGVDAEYKPLNDIASPAGKIGGAAQKRLASGAVLHHVTMAYDMDAERMTRVLRIGREKLSDKGTKSAAKRVDPLKTQTGLPRDEIIDRMVQVFTQRHGATRDVITEVEYARARALVDEKFATAEWTNRVP